MDTNKTQVYNLIILDKSGSMESIRQEAINGYNETIGSIKAPSSSTQTARSISYR